MQKIPVVPHLLSCLVLRNIFMFGCKIPEWLMKPQREWYLITNVVVSFFSFEVRGWHLSSVVPPTSKALHWHKLGSLNTVWWKRKWGFKTAKLYEANKVHSTPVWITKEAHFLKMSNYEKEKEQVIQQHRDISMLESVYTVGQWEGEQPPHLLNFNVTLFTKFLYHQTTYWNQTALKN